MARAVDKRRRPTLGKAEGAIIRFLDGLNWLDGQRLRQVLEPYRRALFLQFFGEVDSYGYPRYNLGLFGRAKKNWKSADAVIAGCYALTSDSPSGSQVLIVANDKGQAADDLDLAKKLASWVWRIVRGGSVRARNSLRRGNQQRCVPHPPDMPRMSERFRGTVDICLPRFVVMVRSRSHSRWRAMCPALKRAFRISSQAYGKLSPRAW